MKQAARAAKSRRKSPKQGSKIDDGANGFYVDFIEGRAHHLGERLRARGKSLESQLGDTLKETIEKWLVRETLLQSERAVAYRAGLSLKDKVSRVRKRLALEADQNKWLDHPR